MTIYDEFVDMGDSALNDRHDPVAARRCYLGALALSGPEDRHCQRMIGDCHQQEGNPLMAIPWYEQALEGATDYERGNILRDMAASRSGSGDLPIVLGLLNESLRLLPYTTYPTECAASLSFLARAKMMLGLPDEALEHFAMADSIMSSQSNCVLELHNKIPYALALSQSRDWRNKLRSRQVALQALRLAFHHGKPNCRQKALLVLIGGHRLYEKFMARRDQ